MSKASVESTLLVFAVNNPRADEAWQTLVDGDFLFASSAVVTGLFPHASNTMALRFNDIFEIPGTRVRLPLSQPYLYSQWVTLEQLRRDKHLLTVIFFLLHRLSSLDCFGMLRTLWPCDSMIFEIPGTRVRLPLSQPYLYSL